MFMEHDFPQNFRLIYAIYILIHKFYWRIFIQVVNNNVVMMFKRNIWKEKMWLIEWILSSVRFAAVPILRWSHTSFHMRNGWQHEHCIWNEIQIAIDNAGEWIWIFFFHTHI